MLGSGSSPDPNIFAVKKFRIYVHVFLRISPVSNKLVTRHNSHSSAISSRQIRNSLFVGRLRVPSGAEGKYFSHISWFPFSQAVRIAVLMALSTPA